MKRIVLLGATGSIGRSACDVVRAHPDDFRIVALAVRNSRAEAEALGREFGAAVYSGEDGALRAVEETEADVVLVATVGLSGLRPTLAAIRKGMAVALATKEVLVAAGALVMQAARAAGVPILPVDSEHSAIFQCLQGNSMNRISKIILTASGGPFFGKKKEDLENVTVADALNHPNWSMGNKITIDSSTLMNKGFEFIEAKWLFNLEPDQIEVVVHRQSVLHSAVQFEDFSVIGQMGVPDMRIPIQYALLYPERKECPTKPLSLTDYATLTFEEPDLETFDCLALCIEAIKKGGAYPCIVNAANEVAVSLFLNGKIRFLQIGELVRSAYEHFRFKEINNYEDVIAADTAAREYVRNIVE